MRTVQDGLEAKAYRSSPPCSGNFSPRFPPLLRFSLSLKQSLLYGASCAIGGDLAHTALASSTRFVELDAAAWSNNTVRVVAGNVSLATFDLGAATLSVQVTKRRVP